MEKKNTPKTPTQSEDKKTDRTKQEEDLDKALKDTFPASDPPTNY